MCLSLAGRGPVDVAGPSQDSLQPYRAEQYQEELLQRNSEEFHQQSSTGRRLIRVPTGIRNTKLHPRFHTNFTYFTPDRPKFPAQKRSAFN